MTIIKKYLAVFRKDFYMISEDLQDKTLNLNPIDKIHLVEILLESLDNPDPQIEKTWVKESEKRYNAYKAGKIEAIPLDEIRQRFTK